MYISQVGDTEFYQNQSSLNFVYLGVLPELMDIPRIAFGSNLFIVGEPKDTTYLAAKVNEIDAGIINSWKELHYKT